MTIINHRCAVLGKPIAHSLSPVLHNAAYRALGFDDWRYGKYEVGEGDLEGFLRSCDCQWAGLSLTMPLKKTIQPYGEPSNVWAKELSVANTAVFDWAEPNASGVFGIPAIRLYNTDVLGIQLAFEHSYEIRGVAVPCDRSREAVVIGNGNTATSALAACTMMPDIGHVTVMARHPGKNPDLEPLARKFLRAAIPSTSSAWMTLRAPCTRRMSSSTPFQAMRRTASPGSCLTPLCQQKEHCWMSCMILVRPV